MFVRLTLKRWEDVLRVAPVVLRGGVLEAEGLDPAEIEAIADMLLGVARGLNIHTMSGPDRLLAACMDVQQPNPGRFAEVLFEHCAEDSRVRVLATQLLQAPRAHPEMRWAALQAVERLHPTKATQWRTQLSAEPTEVGAQAILLCAHTATPVHPRALRRMGVSPDIDEALAQAVNADSPEMQAAFLSSDVAVLVKRALLGALKVGADETQLWPLLGSPHHQAAVAVLGAHGTGRSVPFLRAHKEEGAIDQLQSRIGRGLLGGLSGATTGGELTLGQAKSSV